MVIQFNLQHKGKRNGAAYQLSFKNTMPYYLKEVATYAASTAYKDKMILRYFLSEPTFLVEWTRKYGRLKMMRGYFRLSPISKCAHISQVEMQLNGIITEFFNICPNFTTIIV
jgi:hypothetical protein